MAWTCKRCGWDFIHYHAPGKSKRVLALVMDKLDEDKIIPMSYPWKGYWTEAPVYSHWVMTSKEKGGTYEFMEVEKIVEGFVKGEIKMTNNDLRMKNLR